MKRTLGWEEYSSSNLAQTLGLDVRPENTRKKCMCVSGCMVKATFLIRTESSYIDAWTLSIASHRPSSEEDTTRANQAWLNIRRARSKIYSPFRPGQNTPYIASMWTSDIVLTAQVTLIKAPEELSSYLVKTNSLSNLLYWSTGT